MAYTLIKNYSIFYYELYGNYLDECALNLSIDTNKFILNRGEYVNLSANEKSHWI